LLILAVKPFPPGCNRLTPDPDDLGCLAIGFAQNQKIDAVRLLRVSSGDRIAHALIEGLFISSWVNVI
jgi:hypothetical protein